MKETLHFQLATMRGRFAAVAGALLVLVVFGAAPEVSAQVQDITPPVLVGHTLSPTSIDITQSSKQIDLTATVTDDLGGVKNVTMYLRSQSGRQFFGYGLTKQQNSANTYATKLTFGADSLEPGTWSVAYVFVEDNLGNVRYYYGPVYCPSCSPQIPVGGSMTFQVVSDFTYPPPATAPTIVSASVTPASVNTSTGQATVTVEVLAQGTAASPVTYVQAQVYGPPNSTNSYRQGYGAGLSKVSNAQVGADQALFRGNITLPQYSASGTWYLGQIYTSNATTGQWYYNTDTFPFSSPALPADARKTLEVVSNPSDTTPPTLQVFDFTPKATDVSGASRTIRFNATITDDYKGTSNVHLRLISPPLPGGSVQTRTVSLSRVGGSSSTSWAADFSLLQYSAAGNWRVDYVYLQDGLGNYRYIFQQELESLGFPNNLQVSSGLSVANATGTFGTTTSLAATLTAGGLPQANRSITFKLNGLTVGSATTGSDGVAKLENVSIGGINAGTYYNVVVASLDGDATISGQANLTVNKANATLALSGLEQTYTGGQRPVTVTTTPSGLPGVTITYNGSTVAPSAVGSYAVVAKLNHTNYAAADATGTLVISGASVTITLGNLSHTYTGTRKDATATTSPANVPVTFSYTQNGQPATPVDVGSYGVTATSNSPSYTGSATGTLVIGKAAQTITFAQPADKRFGDAAFALSATASSNLPVTYAVVSGPATVAGSQVTITGAGDVTIRASQAGNTNYNAATDVDRTFKVTKATATVTFDPASLLHTYDGSLKEPVATTTPSGRSLMFTYAQNSVEALPKNAGSYVVTATIDDPNFQGSATATLVIDKAEANVVLSNLTHTYNGNAAAATAQTTPANLNVTFAYSQNNEAANPVNAGTYQVAATINDLNYKGTATGTLVVKRAVAQIALTGLTQTYNGSAKNVGATTTPQGLDFAVAYTRNGATVVPIDAGDYDVTVTVDTLNYEGIKTGRLTIEKAVAQVTLSDLVHTYDGDTKGASAATNPAGRAVTLVYKQGDAVVTPKNAGAYTITATVDDPNYTGSATGTLTIDKAQATVVLGSLTQTYTGSVLEATATTTPGDRALTFAYKQNGVVAQPKNAGSYEVTATVNDPNFEGSATGTLVINKATVTITVSGLSHTFNGNAKAATASTSPINVPVTLTYSPVASPTNAGEYTVVASIDNPNYEADPVERTLVIAKADQTITFGALAGKTYGDAPITVGGTSSSTLPLTFSIVSGPATIAGNTITITGAGTVVVRASQAGSSNYNAAPNVDQSFVVAKANQTVTWATPGFIIVGTPLGAAQLNAMVAGVFQNDPTLGALTYTPQAGTVLPAGPSHTLTVVAAETDNYNAATATVQIAVRYVFVGFLAPVDNLPTVNSGRSGRTYPVKWQLKDANGNLITDTTSVVSLTSAAASFSANGADVLEEEVPASATGGTALRYDATAGQFIYNWQSASNWNGGRLLKLKLKDGTEYTAGFTFRK